MMISKFVRSIAEALDGIKDGSTILLGGFGAVGQSVHLIEGLIEQGAKDLVIVANNAGYGRVGLARLLEERRVRRLICSFPRIAGSTIFESLYKNKEIELELVPQGTLAERMRAAGAGIPAFYTPTGPDTMMAHGKEIREFKGRKYVMEEALHGDVALIEAWKADRWGNLVYCQAGRNFNPVCAMAAKMTIAQTQHVVELGELNPEAIVTPGVFVNRVVHIPYGDPQL